MGFLLGSVISNFRTLTYVRTRKANMHIILTHTTKSIQTESLCGTPTSIGGHWVLQIANGRRDRRNLDGYDTIVRVEGSGTSRFRGNKIPFILSGFFNYKTRRIWLERRNMGVRTNVTLYEGVVLGASNSKRIKLSCHILGGNGMLDMFLGHEKIGLWFSRKTNPDVSNLLTQRIEQYFDSLGCDEAKILTQKCEDNSMLEFCRFAKEKGSNETWSTVIEPLIKWQGVNAVNSIKELFEIAMVTYNGSDTVGGDDVIHTKLNNFNQTSWLSNNLRPATSISQLPRIVLYLDTPTARNTLEVCRDWNLMLDQNNYIWRALSCRVFNAADPRDLESHTKGWWRKRFLELCTFLSLSFFFFFSYKIICIYIQVPHKQLVLL